MVIRELDATFGKLKNRKLVLKDGLNVICAPNESGKSTWCAFIRAMLYGIDTSRRSRDDYIPDKIKFQPWSGGVMEGTMRLTAGGKDIILQRTPQGQSPMRKLRATYDLSGEAVEDPSGEALTGASEDVFCRTAFIGQAGVKVAGSDDLDRRIDRLVSSGSEETSYSETDRRLRKWQRELKYNKTGRIPALEDRLENLRSRYDTLKTEYRRLAELKNELDGTEEKAARLRSEMELHRRLEAREAKRRFDRAGEDLKAAGDRLEELRETAGSVTRDDVAGLRGEAATLDMLREIGERDLAEFNRRLTSRDICEERLSRCAVKDVTPEYARSQAAKAAEYNRKAREFASDKKRKAMYIGLAVLCVIGIVLATVFNRSTAALVAGLALAAASGVALYLLPSSDVQSETGRDTILREFGMGSAEELCSAAEEYERCCEDLKNAETGVSVTEEAWNTSRDRIEAGEKSLLEKARRLFPGLENTSRLAAELDGAENRLHELSRAEAEFESAGKIFEMLKEQQPEIDDDMAPLPEPVSDRETARAMMRETMDHLAVLRERYNLALGGLMSMGDPAVTLGEIEETENALRECRRRHEAVSLAAGTLKDADSVLRTRFSPVISRIAGDYMSRMTEGKYRTLQFDRSLDGTVWAEGDPVSRGALSLSQGTRDQLYLSLRLAMCSLMLPDCPVILDDALSNFDDSRMEKALELLLEISDTRQVILFSCHSREAEYFSHDPRVNIITAD